MTEQISCWSCRQRVSVDDVRQEDGYCPLCDQPIDVEDNEVCHNCGGCGTDPNNGDDLCHRCNGYGKEGGGCDDAD